uniref:Uncharacterized protein n=1 Tax=Hanusia phi TaxID=3032 RepID=A0A7S0F1S3_9CRYP
MTAEERIASLERRLQLSRDALKAEQAKHGEDAVDLEGLVFTLRSSLSRACSLIEDESLRPADHEKTGQLAEKIVSLWSNERMLLDKQNEELKAALRARGGGGGGGFDSKHVTNEPASQWWAERKVSAHEALKMLEEATSRHSKAQEKLLNTEKELSEVQDALWKHEEKISELEKLLKSTKKSLDETKSELAEKDLQIAAMKRINERGNFESKLTLQAKKDEEGLAAGEAQMQLHRRIQQLISEVKSKEIRIQGLEMRLMSSSSTSQNKFPTASDLDRTIAVLKAEHEEKNQMLEDQVAGLFKISEERLKLLDEQSTRIKALNDELAHRHKTCEDLRKRLTAQAEALKQGAQTAASLEEKIEKENEELFEARRLRSIAEEQVLLLQKEAENARREAQEARAFEIELRSTATKQKETYGKDMESLHKESEHIKEQLQLAKENNDILEGQLRSAEEKVISLTRELEKWKKDWTNMENDLLQAKNELRGFKKSDHDKNLGLETALAQKESIINRQGDELHDLKLNIRNLQSEVESLTESLNSALHREENLRKHTEQVGHQFQLRLSELQGKLAEAQQTQTELSTSSKTLQEQRDREVVASSEMFKKLEEKAVKEVEYKTRIQQILDMNAKLQKEKDKFEEQVIASNLQAISNKSRWAFSSYQNDILVKKIAELKSENEILKSKLRGAMDALDRAHHGILLTDSEGKKFMENLNKHDEPQDGKQLEILQHELNNAAKEIEFKNKKIVEYARALEQLRSEMKAENARRSLRKDEPATPTLRDDAVELVNSLRNRISELEHENKALLDKLQYAREDMEKEFAEEKGKLKAEIATAHEIADQRLKRLRERDQIYSRLSEKSSRQGSMRGTALELYSEEQELRTGRSSLIAGGSRSPARPRQGSLLKNDGLLSSSTDSLMSSERKHGVFSDTSGSERSLGREEMNFWEESQASERASSMSYDGREDDFLRPSHGSAHQSVQELTFAQFIELLRLKGLLPAVVSEREAAEAFRRTIAENISEDYDRMPFDCFKDCIRQLLQEKDMLSGTYNFDRDVGARREPARNELKAPARSSHNLADRSTRGSEEAAYEEFQQWNRRVADAASSISEED